MGKISVFGTDDTLPTVRGAWLYTLSLLVKSPHTAALVPEFQALGPVIDAALGTQRNLDDASVKATAARVSADTLLDPLVVQIANTLLVVTKNDREDPLFLSYVGNQTPGEIVRPLLGAELVTVAEWIEPLLQESEPMLQAFAAPLAEAVAVGHAAEKEVKAAEKALSDFRLTGERKKVIDAVNAGRGGLFGSLVKLQHENAQLRLPNDWAESFFPHATKETKYGATVAQAEAAVAKIEADLVAAQENLEELKAKAAAREGARGKRTEARAALAASRKAGREKRQEDKALEAAAKKKLK